MRENTEEILENQPAEQPPLTGRALYIERWRGRNPDADEPDDDALYSDAVSQIDELTSKYESLNAPNEKLAQVISENPDLAQFIAMIIAGKSIPRALAECFGGIIDRMDESSLAEYEKGREEVNATFGMRKENVQKFKANLEEYKQANGLSDERMEATTNAILDVQQAFLDFDIPVEVIGIIDKGLHAEEDKAEIIEEVKAEVEADALHIKNQTIEEVKRNRTAGGEVPDLVGRKTGATQNRRQATQNPQIQQAGFVDVLADAEEIR